MKAIRMDLAQESDDPDLRRIMGKNFLDGDIRVSFRRHPSFFHAVSVLGYRSDVMVARNSEQRAVGFGIRSRKKVYLDGQVRDIGYLSALRLDREYRGGLALAKSYRYLRDLHLADSERPLFYFTTIIRGNSRVIGLFEGRRKSLPVYEYIGPYDTYAIHLPLKAKPAMDIERAEACDLEAARDFVNRTNMGKDYSVFLDDSFLEPGGQFLSLETEDIYLARKSGEIVGVMAKWDQSAYKQNVVIGYSRKMLMLKAAFRIYAALKGISPLPEVGGKLDSFNLSLVAIKDGDKKVFRSLFASIAGDSRSKHYNYCLLALSGRDPLAEAVKGFPHTVYGANAYKVYWEEDGRCKLGTDSFNHDISLL